MKRRTRFAAAPALVAACLLGGCSALTGPSPSATTTTATRPAATRSPTSTAGTTSPTTAARVARAQATHEYSSGTPPAEHPAHPSQGPIQAIRAFATAYINWNARTVAADMRLLAAASIGQARSAMQLAAAHTARDYELRRGGISNGGTIEAIAPLSGARDQFVVVTRERTSASNNTAYQGLGAAWHLTLATVARVGPGLWVLSGWQPES